MAKKNWLGSWAFLIGVILAIIFAFFTPVAWVYWVMVIIGLIVGLLNVTGKELTKFMWAGTVFVVVAYFGGQVFALGFPWFGVFLNNLLMLFVPATIIVALKQLFSISNK